MSMGERIYLQKQAAERAMAKSSRLAKEREEKKVVAARSKYVEDPTLSEKMVARLMQSQVHESFAARRKAVPRLPEIEESFNVNDPRKHIGSEVLSDYQSMMQDSEFDRYGPRKLLIAAFMNKMEDSEEGIRKYVHKRRSDIFRTVFPVDYTTPPGQEEWESEMRMPQRTSVGQSIAWGGGFGVAKEVGKKFILKGASEKAIKNRAAQLVLGRKLMQSKSPYLAPIGLALTAIPVDFMIDYVDNKLGETDWGHKHPWLRLAASIGFLGVTGRLAGKITNKLKGTTKKIDDVTERIKNKPATAEDLSVLDTLNRDAAETTEQLEGIIKGELKGKAPVKKQKTIATRPTEDVDEADEWFRRALLEAEEGTPKAKIARREAGLELEEAERHVAKRYISTSDMSPEELMKIGSDVPRARRVASPRYTKEIPESEGVLDVEGIRQRGATAPIEKPKKITTSLSQESRLGKEQANVLRSTYGRKYISGKDYTLDDIPNELLGEVEKRVANGMTKKRAVQETGEMLAVVKSIVNAEKTKVSSDSITKLKRLGYTQQDISRLEPESVRALIQGVENRSTTKIAEKTLHKEITKSVKPERNLEAWARGMSPANLYDAWQAGDIPEAVYSKIRHGKQKAVEEGITHKKYMEKETLLDSAAKDAEALELGSVVKNIVDGKVDVAIGNLERIAVSQAKIKVRKGTATETQEKLVRAAEDANWDAVKSLAKALGASSTTVALLSIFGPESAEAGKFDTTGKVVTKFVAEIIQKSKDPEKMLYAVQDAQLIAKESSDPFTLGQRMKQIYVDPRNIKVSVEKELGLVGRAFGTPFAKMDYYFQHPSGMRQMENPLVVLANGQTAVHVNTLNDTKTFKRILDNVPGARNTSQQVADTMQPMMDKYFMKMQERGYYFQMRNKYAGLHNKLINKLKNEQRKMKKGKKVSVTPQGDAILQQYKKLHGIYGQAYKTYEPMFNSYKEEWVETVSKLSTRNAGTRIFLAAEDTTEFAKYPFLKGMLTFDEQVAAARIKVGMLRYAVDVAEVGGRVLSGPYMHHAIHPSASFKAVREHMKTINPFTTTPPPMTKIHSRAAGFLPMMPDAQYSIEKYLPDINKRIIMRDFWRPGRDDGWEHFSQNIKDLPGMKSVFTEIKSAMRPEYREGFDNYAEKLYGLQVFQLLAGSPSVAFKHMLKEIVELRIFGMDGLKAYPQGVKSVSKLGLRNSGGLDKLKKRGFTPNIWDEAVASFTEQGRLYRVISDMAPYKLNETQWDKVVSRMNDYGAIPVTAIERIGRGISVVAAIKMASKKGMTPAQATYSVYDTIVRTNFLGGSQNPAWIRDPKIRLAMMFQTTRFKIAEMRLRLYGKGIKSVDRARLELMQQIKADVKEGERRFHFNLMKDGLLMERDIFGTPAVQQIWREILLTTAAVGGAKYFFDADIFSHIIHPPFFDLHGEDIAVSSSPIVQAVLGAGQILVDPAEDFVVSDFFKDWFGHASNGWPVPVNFMKAVRLTRGDIPKAYRDNALKYFFGVPAEKERKLK
jgi:hypothetical protein